MYVRKNEVRTGREMSEKEDSGPESSANQTTKLLQRQNFIQRRKVNLDKSEAEADRLKIFLCIIGALVIVALVSFVCVAFCNLSMC